MLMSEKFVKVAILCGSIWHLRQTYDKRKTRAKNRDGNNKREENCKFPRNKFLAKKCHDKISRLRPARDKLDVPTRLRVPIQGGNYGYVYKKKTLTQQLWMKSHNVDQIKRCKIFYLQVTRSFCDKKHIFDVPLQQCNTCICKRLEYFSSDSVLRFQQNLHHNISKWALIREPWITP